jgi:hypothetical protein
MLLLVIFVLFAGALPPSLEQRRCCTQINGRSVIEEMKGLQLLSRNWRFSWSGEMVEMPQERKQKKSRDSTEGSTAEDCDVKAAPCSKRRYGKSIVLLLFFIPLMIFLPKK